MSARAPPRSFLRFDYIEGDIDHALVYGHLNLIGARSWKHNVSSFNIDYHVHWHTGTRRLGDLNGGLERGDLISIAIQHTHVNYSLFVRF